MTATRALRCLGLAVGATLCVAPAAPAAPHGPIVFERDGRLLTVSAPGAPARPLTAGRADHDPAVSPDGRRVAFIRGRDLWVMSADGRSARALTRDGRFHTDPTWTPNGKTIIFSSGAWSGVDLASIAAVGGSPIRRLTATPGHEERHPDVSPDGARVVFDRTGCETPRGGGHCVYVMAAGGGGGGTPVNLTPETVQPGCETQPGFALHGAAREPAWSPDGNHIAFVGPTACDVSHLGTDIWTMAASGGAKVNLTRDAATDDTEPAWSPDGATLLFTREGTNVMALPAGGGAASPVAGGIDATWGARRASP